MASVKNKMVRKRIEKRNLLIVYMWNEMLSHKTIAKCLKINHLSVLRVVHNYRKRDPKMVRRHTAVRVY